MTTVVNVDTLLSAGGLPSPLVMGTPLPEGLQSQINLLTQASPDTILPLDDTDSGIYRIAGSVNEVVNGVSQPRLARVFLIVQDRWATIRSTYSDPVTGAYEFTGLRGGVRYAVVARPYNGEHLSVIADKLEPTL